MKPEKLSDIITMCAHDMSTRDIEKEARVSHTTIVTIKNTYRDEIKKVKTWVYQLRKQRFNHKPKTN